MKHECSDYNYFNFDTSLSASVVKYLGSGGYNLDAHNFANNKIPPFLKNLETKNFSTIK